MWNSNLDQGLGFSKSEVADCVGDYLGRPGLPHLPVCTWSSSSPIDFGFGHCGGFQAL
jgi:hypothetical protein